LVERRTQDRRVGDLAADAAADARVVHVRDRVLAERIGALAKRERRASIQAHAGVVARAHVGVDAEARLDDLTAGGRLAAQPGPLATLALEHALVPRDDDLEAGDARRQGLADRSDHLGDAVRVHGPDPLHAQAVQR